MRIEKKKRKKNEKYKFKKKIQLYFNKNIKIINNVKYLILIKLYNMNSYYKILQKKFDFKNNKI